MLGFLVDVCQRVFLKKLQRRVVGVVGQFPAADPARHPIWRFLLLLSPHAAATEEAPQTDFDEGERRLDSTDRYLQVVFLGFVSGDREIVGAEGAEQQSEEQVQDLTETSDRE